MIIHVYLCFSLLCYAHTKDTRILRYDAQVVDYDLMPVVMDDINWADIMNPMDTLDGWSNFRTVLKRILLTSFYFLTGQVTRKVLSYMTAEVFNMRKLKHN